MNLRYLIHSSPFLHPFTISKGTKTHQSALFVELEWRGLKGYGEAPAITYYNITSEKMAEDLEKKRAFIEKFSITDPERFWHFLHHLFPNNPFLVCALDMAGWDLWGKMTGKPLHAIWKLDSQAGPDTDYTIGIDTPENMIRKMQEKPWPIYKIKVGFEGDMKLLSRLRKETTARLRVDANAAWTLTEAREKLQQMRDLDIEMVEQPLAKDDWEGMKALYSTSQIPLFADESCVFEQDVERCAGHFHGINIKLTKCSGITPARRMIKKARELGLQVMMGCMNETTVGTAAMIHLKPLLDHLDADGPLLLAEDMASGLEYDFGKVSFKEHTPGLSIVPGGILVGE